MHAPPENRNARLAPGVGRHSAGLKEQSSDKRTAPCWQAIFTARPRGTRWAVAAISPAGEAIKLGVFAHRGLALDAAAIMAGACGGRWLP
jgi:hypothetical protein